MGQQQRKLGHNELPKDQADKLEALLARTKGKKMEGGGGGGGGGSSRKGGRKKRAAADAGSGDSEDEANAQAVEDDGDD
jgi:hypothetical protein